MFVLPIACIMLGCLTELPIEVDGEGFTIRGEPVKTWQIGGRFYKECPIGKKRTSEID